MENTVIQSKIEGRIVIVTLNRPEKRNALNSETVNALQEVFDNYAKNDAIRAIILKANGDAFCAGADLAYLQQLQKNTFEENLEDSNTLRNLFQTIYTYPKPVIAQVQGHAIAGGAGLVSVCDFAFSVPEAKFGFTEVKIGFVPALVGVFAIRKYPEHIVRKLFLTGSLISAAEAKNIGMITEIMTTEILEKSVFDFTENLLNTSSGDSLRLTKEMLSEVYGKNLNDGLDFAANLNALARSTIDCKAGIDAFLNKKQLSW